MARRDREAPEAKILDIDAAMQGTLSFKSPVNLRINGKFEGDLDTKGTLTISENADIKAGIIGENIIIAGKVRGNVKATKELSLIPPAVVTGDIQTPRLAVTPGAILQGNCRMTQDTAELDIEGVAEYLEVEPSVVEEWAGTGKIPGERRDDQWRFDRAEIDRWVAEEKVKI